MYKKKLLKFGFVLFLNRTGASVTYFICNPVIQIRTPNPLYVILKWNNIHAIFKIGFIATVRRINLKKWNLNLQNENFHIHTMWGLNEKKNKQNH